MNWPLVTRAKYQRLEAITKELLHERTRRALLEAEALQVHESLVGLTLEDLAKLASGNTCAHCGGYHVSACPYIAAHEGVGQKVTYIPAFADKVVEIVYDSDIAVAIDALTPKLAPEWSEGAS